MMQKARVHLFKERSLFYVTFSTSKQAKREKDWLFQLDPVYFIAILGFVHDEAEEIQKFRRNVALRNQDGQLFFDRLHFEFLQMPLFTKQERELETHFDKWLYFLKNLENFGHIPAILDEPSVPKGLPPVAPLARTLVQGSLSGLRRWIMLICVDWVAPGFDYVAELAFL
uniref:PD-(D/E)XK nuclease family transposase n=1 Tax=Candidatus Kentrum sp. TC TaxID=2126339 RepID=A0A450ZCR7_9GAMM|nr:MAG: PD-(D/E)XK nuclease family transposase [Candidatus Kentron sp. TC]